MAAYVPVAFPATEAALTKAACTLSVKTMAGVTVDTTGWTLTAHMLGLFSMYIPNVTEQSTYYIYKTADATVYCFGTIGDEYIVADAVVGGGSILFTWTEYESGHSGDADYVVPDVTVMVYNNNTATGTPITSGVTDELGQVKFYLDAGTYYLFRRKTGRAFTNPQTIGVS